MEAVCNPKLECISANGNANVYRTMRQQPETDQLTVLADGAAFGAFISDVLAYALERRKVRLYFPESFEWVILLSGVVDGNEVEKILACPEDYIEGSAFFSWEQFFTEYLRKITKDDEIRHYQKEHLRSYYKTGQVMERIKSVFPEEIQNMLDKCDS